MITRSEETIALLGDSTAYRGPPRGGRAGPGAAGLAERQPLHLPRLPRVRAGPTTSDVRRPGSSRSRPPGWASCAPTPTCPGPSAPCRRRSGRADLMVITKDNYKSRVHRPAYLDYLGIRHFDDDGRVTGERRFLGLFSSSAYSESVTRVPVLRQKAAAMLRHTGYSEQSHGGKAVMDVLETYPRDELFQARIDRPGRPRWRSWPTSRNAGRSGCSSAATPTAATCPAWSTCPGTATPRRSGSGWRRSCSVGWAPPRSTTPPGSASRCSPGCTSWSGCRWARPWARSTYAVWSASSPWPPASWTDEFADLIGRRRRPGAAGHPGRRAAGGLQGGLHPAAGGPGPRRADRSGRRPRHVDGPLRPRPRRRRGRPAAEDLPPRRVAVAVGDAAAPDPARRRRDRRAAVRDRARVRRARATSTTSG